jgi:hypothetical protein
MNDPSIDIITRFTDDIVSRVSSELGRENLRSVFFGGSVAGGEVSYCVTERGVEIYSDVDLYIVVGDDVQLEDARRRAREMTADVPLEGNGYRFYRAPDLGVYTLDDLAAQPARPGTVGLEVKHRMLLGDPEVPGRAAARIGEHIEIEEALYLLENRLSELAALQAERRNEDFRVRAGDDRFYAFVVCKTALDVGAARLVAGGEFTPHRKEQRERLEPLLGDAGDRDRMAPVEACANAMSRMPSPEWAEKVPPEDTANAVVSAALAEWKRIAAACLPGRGDDWSDMVLRRCHTGEYLNNFRQFRALNARCRFKRRGALAVGVHLSRYSPVDALRLSAMMEYLYRDAAIEPETSALVQTLGPFLDRLTRECGFSRGSLAERSYEMYRAIQ